jgi:Na+-transporting NADH:ubiquinone oxidoreductase subunit NqrD
MDSSFWLGVVVTTVLAVPAGMLAIFLYGRFVQLLDSRKLISQEKRKKAAIAFHKLILDLRSGRRDKYTYMLRMALSGFSGLSAAVTCVIGVAIVSALTPAQGNGWSLESFVDGTRATHGFVLFLMFAGLVFMFLAHSILNRFRKIARALENFDRYETQYRSRWGDTAED